MCRSHIDACDSQVLPDLRDRFLQLLEHRQEPMHRPEPRTQAPYGAGDLPGVERVVDPPVRRQPPPYLRWSSGSQVTTASSTPGSFAGASTNSVVASSR